jgi:asparagine synthase (glutamine-hydrolysing)
MCGILFYRREGADPRDAAVARAMAHIQIRGPDGQRTEAGKDFVMGHTRLAIIDPNEIAAQPFTDATGRFVISYNGEIYNYAELRQDLLARGARLRSNSDTEVLIELLVRDGWDKVHKRLRGMFAFVFVDKLSGSTLIARDHFGQKPVYWFQKGKTFGVASDPLCLVELGAGKAPDKVSFGLYASTRAETGTRGLFHPDRSMFAEINVLPAGHTLQLKDDQVRIERYFSPHELYDGATAARRRSQSDDALADEVSDLLRGSVARHLVADVPVGNLLSGGVDSSLVHWYAAQQTEELTAFVKVSPGIEDIPQTVVPELLRRRPASAFYHVMKPENYLQELFGFIAATHAPCRWGGGPPMNKLCVDARRNGVVALLGGDCADEVFGGYAHYEDAVAQADTSDLGDSLAVDPNSPFYDAPSATAYEEQQWVLRREIEAAVDGETNPRDKFAQVLLLHDMSTFIQVCNLPNSDAYSMMSSVEVRNPMLDLDLVSFAINLPPRLKAAKHPSGHFGKVLLRNLVDREMGDFMQVRKEGTRNFAMTSADPDFWHLDRFATTDVIGKAVGKFTKRQIVRLINLEVFHRLFFAGGNSDGGFFDSLLTDKGKAFFHLNAAAKAS